MHPSGDKEAMLRILAVAPLFPPSVGGVATYYELYVSRFKKYAEPQGGFLIILTTNPCFTFVRQIQLVSKNISVWRVMPSYEYFKSNMFVKLTYVLLSFILTLFWVLYIFATKKIRIIESYMSLGFGYAATVASIIVGTPLVWKVGDTMGKRGILRAFANLRSPSLVICSDESTEAYMKSLGGELDTIISYLLPDIKPAKVPVRENDEVRFLYVGKLEKRKGVILLLEAFKSLLREFGDASLSIVGDGSLSRNISEFVREQNVHGKVSYVGVVPHRMVYRLISDSDALVLPSFTEGLPRVVCESLLCGTPVICSNVGQLGALVKHGFNGLVLEKIDSETLKTCLVQFCKDRALRYRLCENAFRSMKKYVEIDDKMFLVLVKKYMNLSKR